MEETDQSDIASKKSEITNFRVYERCKVEDAHPWTSIGVSPTGRNAILGLGKGNIGLFDLLDNAARATIPVSLSPVQCLQWHPMRQKYIAASVGRCLLVLNFSTSDGTKLNRLRETLEDGHHRAITDIEWHPQVGQILATTSLDAQIMIWDMKGRHSRWFGGSAAQSTKWSPTDTHVLATGHSDGVKIWDLRGAENPVRHWKTCSSARDVTWNPTKSDVVASIHSDDSLVRWDLRNSRPLTSISHPSRSFLWTNQGIIVASRDSLCVGLLEQSLLMPLKSIHVGSQVLKIVKFFGGDGGESFALWCSDKTVRVLRDPSCLQKSEPSYTDYTFLPQNPGIPDFLSYLEALQKTPRPSYPARPPKKNRFEEICESEASKYPGIVTIRKLDLRQSICTFQLRTCGYELLLNVEKGRNSRVHTLRGLTLLHVAEMRERLQQVNTVPSALKAVLSYLNPEFKPSIPETEEVAPGPPPILVSSFPLESTQVLGKDDGALYTILNDQESSSSEDESNAAGSTHGQSIPFPSLCGARFTTDGQLVVFLLSLATPSNRIGRDIPDRNTASFTGVIAEHPRSYEHLSKFKDQLLSPPKVISKAIEPAADVDSHELANELLTAIGSPLLGRTPESPAHASRLESSLGMYESPSRRPSLGISAAARKLSCGTKRGDLPICPVIQSYDLHCELPCSKRLALCYRYTVKVLAAPRLRFRRLLGENVSFQEVCSHNLQTVRLLSPQRNDLVEAWTIAGALRSTGQDITRQLVDLMFDHFEAVKDVQMVAMLGMLFDSQVSAHDQETPAAVLEHHDAVAVTVFPISPLHRPRRRHLATSCYTRLLYGWGCTNSAEYFERMIPTRQATLRRPKKPATSSRLRWQSRW